MRPTLLLAATSSLTFSLTSHTCSPRVDKKISKIEFFLKKKKGQNTCNREKLIRVVPLWKGHPSLQPRAWACSLPVGTLALVIDSCAPSVPACKGQPVF